MTNAKPIDDTGADQRPTAGANRCPRAWIANPSESGIRMPMIRVRQISTSGSMTASGTTMTAQIGIATMLTSSSTMTSAMASGTSPRASWAVLRPSGPAAAVPTISRPTA